MSNNTRKYLLDVSRLIWRLWDGKLPTGIDRVCLEYVSHFGPRSQAVVQFKGRTFVLGPKHSDRLFTLLLGGRRELRLALSTFAIRALAGAKSAAPRPEMLYLNVGHTGLDDRRLGKWLESSRCRPVYLIHDLIPITHPHFCRAGEEKKHDARLRNALTNAAGIIGNSKATLDELGGFASIHRLRMPSTIVGWISGYRANPNRRESPFDRPFFITVGTIEGRKNHILLLRLWDRLADEMKGDTPSLVVVGQRGWNAEQAIAMLDNSDGGSFIREFSNCDDDQLHDLIASATALLMPSFTEGFGLPIIEALRAGTPVIASDLPVYREVVGEIPTYLDPRDEAAWDRTIREFLTGGPEPERQRLAMRGFTPPDWEQHFATVESWLATLG